MSIEHKIGRVKEIEIHPQSAIKKVRCIYVNEEPSFDLSLLFCISIVIEGQGTTNQNVGNVSYMSRSCSKTQRLIMLQGKCKFYSDLSTIGIKVL